MIGSINKLECKLVFDFVLFKFVILVEFPLNERTVMTSKYRCDLLDDIEVVVTYVNIDSWCNCSFVRLMLSNFLKNTCI